jgi:hypothetical protein
MCFRSTKSSWQPGLECQIKINHAEENAIEAKTSLNLEDSFNHFLPWLRILDLRVRMRPKVKKKHHIIFMMAFSTLESVDNEEFKYGI